MSADSETLVENCWKRHRHDISFLHNEKHSKKDAEGEDFSEVRLRGYNFSVPIQIKTSDNGTTLGLVGSADRPDVRSRLSPKMRSLADHHFAIHKDIQCVLFVAKPDRNLTDAKVCSDIWQETISIFEQYWDKQPAGSSQTRPSQQSRLSPSTTCIRR